MIRVSELTIYPVKSMAGIGLQQVQLDRRGPLHDRRWMVVDPLGTLITQREVAAMARIEARPDQAGLELNLDGQACRVDRPGADARAVNVRVWDDTVTAQDAGDAVADWLSARLSRPCHLVYMPDETRRLVDPRYAQHGETVSFADGFPLLLISQASLDDLNARLERPVPMNRFRPNIVVSGCAAFAEDGWRRVRIGDVDMQVSKACSRCVMPSIDQRSAQKDKGILRVLASYRRRDGVVYFGQNLLHAGDGELATGQTLEVLE